MFNWSRSIFCWNLALDETGKPHIGPFFQHGKQDGGGLLQVHTKTNEVSYGCQYYALGHFSQFVKRGAVCLTSTCSVPDLYQVAFQNPDGSHVLVIVNTGAETEATIKIGGEHALVVIPEISMITLVF